LSRGEKFESQEKRIILARGWGTPGVEVFRKVEGLEKRRQKRTRMGPTKMSRVEIGECKISRQRRSGA